ncbi:hypothetical protein BD309DRAFT_945523 [Dichomitus squalens]|uniref:4a-hydroxytetrahydrobiopterin dehydratase n=1 Tax=Dichomitus squalens TaxID=114155 RepID=A0A4Q9Q673_9APHY|nr:hypothetical protein BD309DRAFT_945523 [Dichomitus squalens]TBU62953.1 hypothetical protein BD310DRAFT_917494 [Dichomitus squalens]
MTSPGNFRLKPSCLPDAPLPGLPPAPPYPCPFLTDEEITTYLLPLYSRGWTVRPSKTSGGNKPAPELVKAFSFESRSNLDGFMLKVSELTQSENHHPTIDDSSDEATRTIRVHTHSGLRPASHPGERRKDRVQPGITLRDIRYAYLFEDLFERCEGARYRELERSDIRAQPTSPEAIEARRHHVGE